MIPWKNSTRFFNKALKQPAYAASVLMRRVKAYYSYFFLKGKSAYPEAITLFLTHRCNLRCVMCGQWGEGGVTRKQNAQFIRSELSLDEIKSIIDDFSQFNPNITLFGGEPLLHPACIDIIKYIKSKHMHCLMITNGSLIKGLASSIVESGLDELNVSVDGGAQLHDRIRGMPGLFDQIMQGLTEIKRLKGTLRKKKPFLNLQCTINKHNYKRLDELLDVAASAGADSLTFHNLIFLDRELIDRQKEHDESLHCSSLDWEGFVFDPGIEPEILYEQMERIYALKSGYSFAVDFYPNLTRQALLDYYRNRSYKPSEYPGRCISPWVVAYIFPDGEVRPCLNFSYSYGNIRQERFSRLWNNDSAVRFRAALKKTRSFPVCVRCTELYRY